MKVFQINVTLNTGSTGRIAEDIGKSVLRTGGESYIAYGRNSNKSASKAIKIGRSFDQFHHLLFTRLFDTHALHSQRATKVLINQIASIQPDVIHLHNLHGYYLNIEVLFNFLRTFGRPVVWTLHDCWAFTGHCSFFDHVACDKWKTKCGQCPLKTRYPASYFVDRSDLNFAEKKQIFNSLDNLTIVSVSKWLKQLVDSSFLNGNHSVTIYNGVDLRVFRPHLCLSSSQKERYRIGDGKFVLAVASVWSERKGLSDIIRLRSLMDPRIVIVIVGLTNEQIERLPANIVGIPHTDSSEDLASLYSSAEVFINPSILETFGMVTAEALSCGTPVVAYNATATPELIKGGTGFLVKKGDVEELARAVSSVLSHGKEKYSARCREIAESLFDKDVQYRMYVNLYKSLLST